MLNQLLPALNDCVTAFDLDEQRYLFISPAAGTILGRDPADFYVNRDLWHELIDERDREMVINDQNTTEPGQWIESTYRIVTPSAKIKWVDEKRSIYEDENGHKVLLRVVKDAASATIIENDKIALAHEVDFDILFNSNPSPMWIYEIATFSILKVNKAAVQLYGFVEEVLLTMTIQQLRPESELAKLQDFIHRYISGKKNQQHFTANGVWKHQKKNGEILYVDIISRDIRFNDKACQLIIATDVTEKIRFQEERKRREQFLTSLIDSQTNFLIRIDSKGVYTFANKQFLKVFGFKASKLIGSHFSTTTLPEEEELCNQAFFDCMHNPGMVVPLIHRKPDKWGNKHITEWEFISITDDEGQITEIQGVGQDITRRIKNESEIKFVQEEVVLTKNNLEALINNTDDHIWSVDKETRYVYMNDAYIRTIAFLTGVQPIAGAYSYLHAGYNQETLDEWKDFYERALNGERYTIRRESLDSHGKKKLYFEVSFNPIYKISGEIIGVGCFAHNITAELEKEEALIEQNARLRNIASLSSHELRRPVTTLLGLIHILDQENFNNPDNEEIIRHLGSVGEEIDQVIRLIVNKTFIA